MERMTGIRCIRDKMFLCICSTKEGTKTLLYGELVSTTECITL